MIDFEPIDTKITTHFNRTFMVLDKLKGYVIASNHALVQVAQILHMQSRHEDAEIIENIVANSANIADELREALGNIGDDMGEYSDLLKKLHKTVDDTLFKD